jgi:6-phosphofructokinase 2
MIMFAPNVAKSTVGAGDSMVVEWLGIGSKKTLEVIRWGVALIAATMNEGTQLFKLEDAKII